MKDTTMTRNGALMRLVKRIRGKRPVAYAAPAASDNETGSPEEKAALRRTSSRPFSASFRSCGLFGRLKTNVRELAGYPGFRHGDVKHFDRLASILPIADIDGEGLATLTGSTPDVSEGIGFVLEIRPQTGATDAIQNELIGITSNCPAGTVVTMTVYASPMIEGLLEWMAPSREDLLAMAARVPMRPVKKSTAEMLFGLSDAMRAHLRELARGDAAPTQSVLPRHFRAWLTCIVPAADPHDAALRKEVLNIREGMMATLSANALLAGAWDGDTLVGTLAELLAPHRARTGSLLHPLFNPFSPVNEQVTLPDTEVTILKHGIRFATTLAASEKGTTWENAPEDTGRAKPDDALTPHATERYPADCPPVVATSHVLTTYPNPWHLISASLLAGSPERGGAQILSPFLLTSVVKVLDRQGERLNAEAHRMRALQMMHTPLTNFSPYYPNKARNWRIAEESFKSEGGIALVGHFLTTFTKPEHSALINQTAAGIARQLGGDWHALTGLHTLGLMAGLPLTCGPLLLKDMQKTGIVERRTAATATAGAPIVLDWQGTGVRADRSRPTPLVTLIGRRGEIMPVDPFANPNGGYSIGIVGSPGSGKSVLMNEMVTAALLRGGIVWVIDIGHSYRKICDFLDGEYLTFSETDIWDLNPLQLLKPDSVERLDDVVSVINALLTPGALLGAYERSVLIQVINEAVNRAAALGRSATLADLYALLAPFAAEDIRARDLRSLLQPYLTAYAKWFDGRGKPLTFANRFTVLELEGLSGHPALRQAVLMMLMLIIEETMECDRTTIKMIFIDEAWDLMGNAATAGFIESGFRRARKHKASFVVATQNLADFWHSPTAHAAWSCADTRFFLRQDADIVAALMAQKQFVASDGLLEMIRSLTTVAGEYAEMLVETGDQPPAIGRLTLDRLSQLLFSSNPSEVSAINAWRAAGCDILSAVRHVAAGDTAPATAADERLSEAA